jgi:hypothetical protein
MERARMISEPLPSTVTSNWTAKAILHDDNN